MNTFDVSIEFDMKKLQRIMDAPPKIRREAMRRILNVARKGMRRIATQMRERIRRDSGLGRTIWGKKAGGLSKLVSVGRARQFPDGFEIAVKLKGLPAMIEQGGHIKAHQIPKRKGGRLMAFSVGGKRVFAKRVNHPGAAVRPHRFAEPLVAKEAPLLGKEMGTEIAAVLREVLGA